MNQSSPNGEPPSEAFTCEGCGRVEPLPESYLRDLMARHREWFVQALTGDNFQRPGRRMMFRGRVEDGKVVATVEKRPGQAEQ